METVANPAEFAYKFFRSSSFRSYNVPLAKLLGGVEYAVILYDLVDQYFYLEEKERLTIHPEFGDDLFFYTESIAWERCAIQPKTLLTAVRKLESLKIIQTFKFGLPHKKYFKINFEALMKWINSNISSRSSQRSDRKLPKEQLKTPKGATYDPKDNPKDNPNVCSVSDDAQKQLSDQNEEKDQENETSKDSLLFFRNASGKIQSITKEKIASHLESFTCDIISQVIKIIRDYDGKITDILSYSLSIAKNIFNKQKRDEKKNDNSNQRKNIRSNNNQRTGEFVNGVRVN